MGKDTIKTENNPSASSDPMQPLVSFEEFTSGQSVSQRDISEFIKLAGYDPNIEFITYGYYRKIIIKFSDKTKVDYVAKIAFHPYSIDLLKKEILGYQNYSEKYPKFSYPKICYYQEYSNYSISIMNFLPGLPAKYWSYSNCIPSINLNSIKYKNVSHYLDQLKLLCNLSTPLKNLIEKSNEKYTQQNIPIGQSHGDFIYWNILMNKSQCSLIDFEFYSNSRCLGFDHWHWFIYPLARKCIRFNLPILMNLGIHFIKKIIWNLFIKNNFHAVQKTTTEQSFSNLLLLLYLIEQSVIFEKEHSIPNIKELLGDETVQLRNKVKDLYIQIGNNLL